METREKSLSEIVGKEQADNESEYFEVTWGTLNYKGTWKNFERSLKVLFSTMPPLTLPFGEIEDAERDMRTLNGEKPSVLEMEIV